MKWKRICELFGAGANGRAGLLECWYEGYCSAKSVTFQWGSIYTGNAANIHSVPYPIAFTENPDCIISNANAELGNQWLVLPMITARSQTPSWQLARGTSEQARAVIICCMPAENGNKEKV